MPKKILFIDMDGVIADFKKGIQTIDPSFAIDWSMQERVKAICLQNPEIFHTLEPIEDAIESVEKLFGRFDVYFASVPMDILPSSFTGKKTWIDKHFGKKAAQRLILTHRKDLLRGDLIIDDSLHFGVDKFNGHHIHFATQNFPDWKTTLPYMSQFTQ